MQEFCQRAQHGRNAMHLAPLAASPLTIVGFGACMISGYPHKGGSFFEAACRAVEKGLSRMVQSHIVSLEGFPAPRAKKYIQQQVIDKYKPDYVVIQFGQTDAHCQIRKPTNRRLQSGAATPANDHPFSSFSDFLRSGAVTIPILSLALGTAVPRAPTMLSPVRWELLSLWASIRKISPITSLKAYIEAIEHMTNDCISAGVKPVVLSPFLYGSRYAMRNAVVYTNALRELHSEKRDVIFIDCLSGLSKFRKSELLLTDGFHISEMAHRILGELIGEAIVADITDTYRNGSSGRSLQLEDASARTRVNRAT